MLQIIDSPHREVVVIKATGVLTDQDYKEFVPKLETIIKERGPLSVLLEFENFRGWKPKALWDDFTLGMEHDTDFRRMAIVGQRTLHHLFAVIVRAFTSAEVRYFEQNEIQKAWDWILEKDTDSKEGNLPEGEKGEREEQQAVEVRPYRRIITAMDFSPHAQKALKRAVELARFYNASLSVIHVHEIMIPYDLYQDDFTGTTPAFSMYNMELDEQLFESARKRLNEMVSQIDYPDITVEVISGSPSSTIISYAESQKADLIVAGSHGHKGLARLLGSTANSIMHSARCDVLVVKLD